MLNWVLSTFESIDVQNVQTVDSPENVMSSETGIKILSDNRQAGHNYFLFGQRL